MYLLSQHFLEPIEYKLNAIIKDVQFLLKKNKYRSPNKPWKRPFERKSYIIETKQNDSFKFNPVVIKKRESSISSVTNKFKNYIPKSKTEKDKLQYEKFEIYLLFKENLSH